VTGAVEQVTIGGLSIANAGVVGGDFRVSVERPAYSVAAFSTATPEMDDLRQSGPSGLLQSASRVVDFVGRRSELTHLTSWLGDPAACAVMLLHGPGGQGKTRLAAQLAELAGTAGWEVIEARHRTDPAASEPYDDPARRGHGLLAVVDYAERWPHTDLKRFLLTGPRHPGGPTRILLVARPAGIWWKALEHPLRKARIDSAELALGPLAPTFADRQASFAAARDRFAEILGATHYAGLRPAGSLAAKEYGLVLTLHMAALAAVDAHVRGAVQPAHPDELSAYLLDRECDNWTTLYETGRIASAPSTVSRIVGLSTLVGPIPYPSAIDLVQTVGLADGPAAAQRQLDDHATCYPPEEDQRFLRPMLPDRLGEDYVARLLSSRDGTASAWCAQLIERLLAADGDDGLAGHASSTLAVLVETARRWTQVRQDHLFPLLRRHPRLAVQGGGASLVALAEFADDDVLRALEPQLPRHRDPDLDAGIAAIARRLTDHGLRNTRDDVARGHLYKMLGIRLSNAGLHEDALAATANAVTEYRALAGQDPANAEPELALCLNNLSVHLVNLGRTVQARTAAEEALGIRERLALARPDAFAADLASSWNNLSLILSELNLQEPALAAARAAEALYRQLAEANPATFLPDLAAARNNLGVIHADLGHAAEAFTLAEDTVRLRELLATMNPQAYESDYAMALANLAGRYYVTGRVAEALTLGEQAAELYGRLADTNADAFLPELAAALTNLGNYRAAVGRWEDALAAGSSSVELYRRLAARNPAAHRADLARALTNLAARLSELRDHEAALSVAEEAARTYEHLAAGDPGGFDAGLANALINFSAVLADVGRRDEGLTVIERALDLYRGLASTNPRAYRPALSLVLTNLGLDLSDLGRWDDALRVTEEAVEILRELAGADPLAFEAGLARAVSNLALPLANLGLAERARAAAEEAVAIRTRLAERDPAAFEPELALSLSNLGLLTRDLDDTEEASRAAGKAVEVYRRLAADTPSRFLPELARSLFSYGLVRGSTAAGRADAQQAVLEAARLYEELAGATPDVFGPYVALANKTLEGLRGLADDVPRSPGG